MKPLFVGPSGIRAGWRFVIFVFLLFGLVKLLYWCVTALFNYQEPVGWFARDFALEGFLSLSAALLAAWIMSRIERRPFSEYGLSRRGAFGRNFWEGVIWGLVASIVMLFLLSLLGAAKIEGLALSGRELVRSALWWGFAFLLLGFAEEFAYRGYSQATLAQGMGFWPAAGLISAIFGAIHYFAKPMENWMDAVSVGLFGLFWCFTLWRTGMLWFAIGFHAMSDYADMVIFAQPNTGNHGQPLSGHLLNVTYHGPDWLTGGPRGSEASALEFAVLAGMFVVFARLYPQRADRSRQAGAAAVR